jgi:WD repeat-containing protein 35
MAHDAISSGQSPTTIKKFFVLAALEVERHFIIQKSSKTNTTAALDTLLTADKRSDLDSFSLDKPWRGAEAYHFYLLAQKQFYSGQLEAAVITASHLREYDDIISPSTIYSLLALVSLHAGYFATCSKAFLRLESLDDGNQEHYRDLALEIFTNNKPKDPEGEFAVCTNCMSSVQENDSSCSSCGMIFPVCIASGRPIIESVHFMCHVCKHRALEIEIGSYVNCPLCHTTL